MKVFWKYYQDYKALEAESSDEKLANKVLV